MRYLFQLRARFSGAEGRKAVWFVSNAVVLHMSPALVHPEKFEVVGYTAAGLVDLKWQPSKWETSLFPKPDIHQVKGALVNCKVACRL